MVKLDRLLARPGAQIAFADLNAASERGVVLTHGAGVDHSMFEAQAAALADRGYRVVLWDLRGHGLSVLAEGARFTAADALDDLDALLGECGLAAPVLVGHSLGGNLIQEFAHRHPERLRGAIVMDSTWNAGPLSAMEHLGLRIAAPTLALIPRRRLPGLMATASAVTPAAVTRTQALFATMPKDRFLDVWKATTSFVSPDPGRRFPVPLALIRGEQDRTGNIAAAMERWAAADDAPEYVIPGAGHIVTWDAPQETTDALLEILTGWHATTQGGHA